MKAKQLLLILFLAIQAVTVSMYAVTTVDDVTYSALGLTDDNGWAEDFSGVITSSAEYAGHLQVESGDLVISYGEGSLATTASAGYVSSIVIYWGAAAEDGTDVVDIYASNSAFTGDEFDGDGDYITTIENSGAASDTYNFSSDYSYFLIVSTNVAHINHIVITWTTRASYAITAVASNGNITNPDNSPVSFASVGDVVTLKMTRSGAFCMTGYSVYSTVDPSIKVDDVDYDSPQTSPRTITFTMPGYAVTVEGKYIAAPTATNSVTVQNAGGDNLSDLDAMVSGDVLVYNYTAAADYVGVISVSSNNESIARVVSSPTNAYSGTLTIYAYATGTVKITISFSADTKYKATSKNSKGSTTVSRRPIALVTELDGKCYAVTNTLSGTKMQAMQMIANGGNYFYNPASSVSDITWYAETIYNAKGDRYRIYTSASGTTNLDADGMDFYLDTDVREWKKDGSNLYGASDNRGIVYKTSSGLFESQPYDNHDLSPALYSPSAIEVPITNVAAANLYSTSDALADIYDARSLIVDQLGTICVPFNVPLAFVSGANFYTIENKLVSGSNLTGIILADVTDGLEAGHSYLFTATASSVDIYFGTASATTASTASDDGFLGCLPGDGSYVAGVGGVSPRSDGYYGVKDNQLHYVASGTPKAKPYRALIKASELGTGASAPGRRIMYVDNTATSIEDLLENATFINWNEPVYNMLGQQVGKGTTGVLIQNGQKFLVQ